jgi:hypothetical protein
MGVAATPVVDVSALPVVDGAMRTWFATSDGWA